MKILVLGNALDSPKNRYIKEKILEAYPDAEFVSADKLTKEQWSYVCIDECIQMELRPKPAFKLSEPAPVVSRSDGPRNRWGGLK